MFLVSFNFTVFFLLQLELHFSDFIENLENYVVTSHNFDMVLSVCKNCRTYRNMYALLWVRLLLLTKMIVKPTET